MLGSRSPRGCASAPDVTTADRGSGRGTGSGGAAVSRSKTYGRSSQVKKIAAESTVPLPAITSSGRGAASRGGTDTDVRGSGDAASCGLAPLSPKSSSAGVGLQAATSMVEEDAFSPAAVSSTLTLPHSDEEVTQYVLYDGLPQIGSAARCTRKRQSEAYNQFRYRIHERADAAHALVLSANPLSLSVMTSQMRMYRWRVTQAQTLMEATAILQDYVIDATRHGYRVRRRAPPPAGQSRYAHGRGRAALKRRAVAELERLSGIKAPVENGAGASLDGGRVGKGVGAALRRSKESGAPDSRTAEGVTEEDETDPDETAVEDEAESALPPPPPDMLPRLVLVDAFTHEDLGDIARHVRFVDKEHGLELLLVLLLPSDAGAMTASMQGAGCVITPTHQMTMEDAYAAGYDLVLAHNMDHLLVDFFTREFVSSVGRWRNDVRSKAAVGNYMSLRSVLLGGLDTSALQRLVWDDRVDDTGVLELLGAQSLCTQGEAQRYGAATRYLLQQQGNATKDAAQTRRCNSGAGVFNQDSSGRPDDSLAQSLDVPIRGTSVPHLRSRPTSVAHFGVRLPAQQSAEHESYLNFCTNRDVFSSVMVQPGSSPQLRRARRNGQIGTTEDLECDTDNNADESSHQQSLLQGALEKELGRVLVENESKQAFINSMQEEVERLRRTVDILRRHQHGGASVSGDSANANHISDLTESGPIIHLSKQQQIFILKERLDAANERIVALLKGRRSSGPPVSPRQRAGGRGGASHRLHRSDKVSESPTHPTPVPSSTAYAVFMIKATVHEAEQMAMLDDDANFSLSQLELHRQELLAAASNPSAHVAAIRKQRQEREKVDQVIYSIQSELQQLGGRLDSSRPGSKRAGSRGSEGLPARIASRLQSALEVLEAQKMRIQNLEELRQMDQLLIKTFSRKGLNVPRRGAGHSTGPTAAISGVSDEADDSDGSNSSADEEGSGHARALDHGRGRKAQQPRTTGRKTTKPHVGLESMRAGRKGATNGGRGVAAPKTVTKGDLDGAEDADRERMRTVDTEEATAQRIAAAVHEAVTSLQRTHRQQLASLVQSCKVQLAQVALKLQKPSTSAYVELIRKELSRAKREQRAAWLRLQFTLSSLSPQQYDATLAKRTPSEAAATEPLSPRTVALTQDADASDRDTAFNLRDCANMVPLGAVTDPNVRSTAANIAREYAAYGLRIAYLCSELQRLERCTTGSPQHLSALAPTAMLAVAETVPEQLVSACQASKARVQAAIDTCGSIQEYLKAVQEELAVEQQFRPWCDVKSAELFSAASTAVVPCTLCLGESVSGSAANEDQALNGIYSPTVFTSADQVVLLADVDASMRDIADVYATILSALKPSDSEASVSVLPTSVGRMSRRRTSSGARVSKKRDTKKRRQPAASPMRSKSTSSKGDVVARAADKSLSGSTIESDSVSHLHSLAVFTVDEALNTLPIQSDEVACYQGQLSSIYGSRGVHSAAQQRLYELVLSAYQQHQIHPLHMAAVESALSVPLPSHSCSRDESANEVSRETSVSMSESLVDFMSAQAGAAHAQHREVMAMLKLIAQTTTTQALQTLTKGLEQVQHMLDREDDGATFAEAFNGTGPPCTSPVFLSAIDAAVLGCIVDELRWRQWRQSLLPSKEDSKESSNREALSASRATPGELLTKLITERTGRSADGNSTTLTADGGAVLEDARTIAHYAAFCAVRERAAHRAHSSQASSMPRAGDSLSSGAEDVFYLTDAPPMVMAPSTVSDLKAFTTTGSENADVGLTVAHDLAVLFSKHCPQDGDDDLDKTEALLAEIYLDNGEYSKAGVLGGDSNTEAMRRIRRELESLQRVKQQRMLELMMRFELQKGRYAGGTGGSNHLVPKVGAAGAHSVDDCTSSSSVDPDRLDFEVKSGSPAWYGMEAAKRVHDILRRRARPDQIIVGGGPHSGSVGIELSRRTAQPGLNTESSSKTGNFGSSSASPDSGVWGQEAEDHASLSKEEAPYTLSPYASHQRSSRGTGRASPSKSRLPPLREHLLSRGQKGPDGLAGNDDNIAPMACLGYLSPRDVLTLSAYGHMDSGGAYAYSGATPLLYNTGSLTEEVLAYREALMRSVGRAVPLPFTTYANGAPYCLPLSTCPASYTAGGTPGSDHYNPLGRQLPSPVPLPDLTSWVYGVPEVYAMSLLQQQPIGSGRPQNMALFMPRYDSSQLTEVEGHRCTRAAPTALPSLNHGRGFPAGATPVTSRYSTPAALAAQRLQAMLSISMRDSSVSAAPVSMKSTGVGPFGVLPTTRGHACSLHSRRSDGFAARQPLSSAPRSRQQSLVGAGADGILPSLDTDRRTTGECKDSEPDCESVLSEKDANPLEETLRPERTGSS